MHASAELVVPKSIPTTYRADTVAVARGRSGVDGGGARGRIRLVPHAELELPAPLAVTRDAPHLERADLGQMDPQAHGDEGAVVVGPREHGGERRQLLDLVAPELEHGAERVVLAAAGPEHAELRRLADHEAELLTRQLELGPLLRALRHEADRLERRRHAGHRRHRRLDPDVVRARR